VETLITFDNRPHLFDHQPNWQLMAFKEIDRAIKSARLRDLLRSSNVSRFTRRKSTSDLSRIFGVQLAEMDQTRSPRQKRALFRRLFLNL
jgi:hypothetical protein